MEQVGSGSTASSSRKRLHNLDFLKALAMLMVVSLHANTWHVQLGSLDDIGAIVQYGCRLFSEGVPLFIMINGFLLFRKKDIDFSAHVKKTLKVLALLVIWSFILAVAGVLTHGGSLAPARIASLMVDTCLGSEYTGVLWYLQALFAVYIVFPFLKLAFDSQDSRIFDYGFAAVAALFVLLSITKTGQTALSAFDPDAIYLTSIRGWVSHLNPTSYIQMFCFFMLGGILCRYEAFFRRTRLQWSLIGVLAFFLSVAVCIWLSLETGEVYDTGFNFRSAFEPFVIIALFCATMGMKENPLTPLIQSIGSTTLGIYFIHFIVIWLLAPLFPATGLLIRLVELIVIYATCYLASWALMKIPGVSWLFKLR